MHAAHLHGIVHRTSAHRIILIDAQAEPHILDFGLAARHSISLSAGGPSKSSTDSFIR